MLRHLGAAFAADKVADISAPCFNTVPPAPLNDVSQGGHTPMYTVIGSGAV